MKTDIEYAALVMGITLERSAWVTIAPDFMYQLNMDGSKKLWEFRPLHDDGDSRRLEIACLNTLYKTTLSTIQAWNSLFDLRHSGKVDPDEYKRRVFALAVAIGKVIDSAAANIGKEGGE
jgi:hypothetical protein